MSQFTQDVKAVLERDPKGVTLTKAWLIQTVAYLASEVERLEEHPVAQVLKDGTTQALTDDVVALRDGLHWLATLHHQVTHKDLIDKGQHSYQDCDAKTCKHTVKVLDEGWRAQ